MREQAHTVDLTNPLDDHLGFLVHDLARAFTAAYTARMSYLGLTRPQARAIAYLQRFPGVTQVELSEYLGVGRMAMTGLLDRMESKGLIERKEDLNDLRVKRVHLTEVAKDTRPQMEAIARELHAGSLSGVSARDLRNTVKVLRRILHNVQSMATDEPEDSAR
ncbi:MAG TPA: MarR family transcriptional regulator [Pseudomonadales bacterium]|jgi:DNA-binding MarR family transcriptional regulator